jgi:hypothetical protein
MTPNYRPFYLFLLAVFGCVIGFGVYVSSLTNCNESKIGPLECHKLYLAFGVLFAIGVLLVVGAGLFALLPAPSSGDAPGKSVFDGFIKVLPPIATLVLGYYFGSTQTETKAERRSQEVPAVEQSGSSPTSGQVKK